ncbi:MAG: C10 family peptidase [Bacteroidales bacterium]
MKLTRQLFFLLISTVVISCTSDVNENIVQNSDKGKSNLEYQSAVQNVLDFNKNSSSKSQNKIEIIESSKKTYKFKITETRSNSPVLSYDSLNIYTFKIKNTKDQNGFVIASGDSRVSKVFAYTEYGDLNDTLYNIGLANTLRSLPYLYKEELCNYYELPKTTTKASQTYLSIGPRSIPEWSQGAPYNNNCPSSSGCSHTLVGCGAIATAQTIAVLNPPVKISGVDYPTVASISKLASYDTSANSQMVSLFCNTVANGINTSFGCSASSSNLNNINNYLRNLRIRTYKYDGNIKINACINSIALYGVVIATGFTRSGLGHAWIYDGVRGNMYLTGNPSQPYSKGNPWPLFHCNWGWGGSSNGWYAQGWEQPSDHEPFLVNNAQIYIEGFN